MYVWDQFVVYYHNNIDRIDPNTTVVDVSRCDNRLFLRPHLELNSDQPSQFHQNLNAKSKKVVKILLATRVFPTMLTWDQAALWENERHLKKISEQSEPTAGYDNTVFANQNCF